MSYTPTRTTNAVRRAFIFNCLNPAMVRVFVGPRRLTIAGAIERLPEHEATITHSTMCALEADIVNSTGIRNVQWRLDNWIHELGVWRSTQPERIRKRRRDDDVREVDAS